MRYGQNWALSSVSVRVEPGEIRAIIGPNGAGKSTFFGVLSGEHRPTKGGVQIADRDVTSLTPHARVRLGVGRTFQVSRVFPSLSVLDNVLAGTVAEARHASMFWRRISRQDRSRAYDLLDEVGLSDRSHAIVSSLSQGDKKRLEIATALALDPRVLLLDEPTAGMSQEETDATVALLQVLWEERRMSMILTEHDMSVVFGLSHSISVLHHGELICTGPPQEIRERDDVQEIYLGER
jgi:branched-chain amino acid transport system ATP-binding protein